MKLQKKGRFLKSQLNRFLLFLNVILWGMNVCLPPHHLFAKNFNPVHAGLAAITIKFSGAYFWVDLPCIALPACLVAKDWRKKPECQASWQAPKHSMQMPVQRIQNRALWVFRAASFLMVQNKHNIKWVGHQLSDYMAKKGGTQQSTCHLCPLNSQHPLSKVPQFSSVCMVTTCHD